MVVPKQMKLLSCVCAAALACALLADAQQIAAPRAMDPTGKYLYGSLSEALATFEVHGAVLNEALPGPMPPNAFSIFCYRRDLEPRSVQYQAHTPSVTFSPSGGFADIAVQTGSGCSWTVESGSSGSASGTVRLRAAANIEPGERAAAISIGDASSRSSGWRDLPVHL
jgi:hypothetical protein